MGSLIELHKFRSGLKKKPKEEGIYFCTQCNRESFRLLQDGRIVCLGCERVMSNLYVSLMPPG